MTGIEVSGLSKAYVLPAERIQVLDDVSLTVDAGESVCIMGSSGSGKSTLVNVLAGLDDADAGDVRVLGHDLTALGERERAAVRLHDIGIIFQDHGLAPDLTAAENIEIVLRARGFSAAESRALALASLDAFGLGPMSARLPRHLSGGQQQRVGVARAVAGGKQVVLADEPTGALDETNSMMLFELLADLASSHGVAVVLCTHDPNARTVTDRSLDLSGGRLV